MKTYNDVKIILSAIEPTEEMYKDFTSDDIPNLQKILKESESWLAARAVFVLGKLNSENANEILYNLVEDPRVEIRVSLASVAGQLPYPLSQKITEKLIKDKVPGVRKFAYSSLPPNVSNDLLGDLKKVMEVEKIPALSDILRKKLLSINK